MATPGLAPSAPKAFISYSWDDEAHRDWVTRLATRLRGDGVDVTLDRWHAAPGDQVPAFMERAVRENDFVIAVCTPRFKEKSDGRAGGVGYEGDIMTAYAFAGGFTKKFIPVLRRGSWQESAPSWLLGRVQVDLSGDPYSEPRYEELVRTLLGAREEAPPVGPPRAFGTGTGSHPGPTREPTTPPPPRSAPPWASAAVAVAALVLIAAVVAAYLAWGHGTGPENPTTENPPSTPGAKTSWRPAPPLSAADLANSSTVLAGIVVDDDGTPLAGVTLVISNWFEVRDIFPADTSELAGRFLPADTSDLTGRFRFHGLRPPDEPERHVRLLATKPGYVDSNTNPPLGSTEHTVRLKKSRNPSEGQP